MDYKKIELNIPNNIDRYITMRNVVDVTRLMSEKRGLADVKYCSKCKFIKQCNKVKI